MVEGHSVHRVATLHRQRLVGKVFQATSPNGRFVEGARKIDGKVFSRIEAIGKNLFAFFGNDDDNKEEEDVIVVHVHFGMSGAWAVFYGNEEDVPEPTKTNRLRLFNADENVTADLSAMTVNWGGMELYTQKKSKLGTDPLRDDADPNGLWTKVAASKKSIGALIMDQSYFTGPGNIYRAEILFKAGVHPDIAGCELEREDFDRIWLHTVTLLRRGYQTGSILTVDPEEARQLGKPKLRRYIYNTSHCPRCGTAVKSWEINKRTCYACPSCQPRRKPVGVAVTPEKDNVPFIAHCASEPAHSRPRTSGPLRLTVKELKHELSQKGIEFPSNARKAALVKLLDACVARSKPNASILSSQDAAAEKAVANESLAVEHIAELAPSQARRARANVKDKAILGSNRQSPAPKKRRRRRR